jgi:glycosyltransferase involved in cell wall biosynthesis
MRIVILTSDNRERYKDYNNRTPSFGPAPEALVQGFAKLGKEVELHVISCLQQPAPAVEKTADNTWYHGLHVPKIGWLRTVYQGCIRAAQKKIREIQPDIVHGQGTERDCSLCAIFSGFPNVMTIHGNMKAIEKFHHGFPGSFYWMSARLETFALKRTSGVFCNSAYTESLVAPRARRTWRVPNALRTPFFETPVEAKKSDPPVLLNIGEIFTRKQQLELMGVARNLHRRGFRFEMQFIGAIEADTDYSRQFLREIAEAQKAGYARHLGKLGIRELIKTMDAASALIHCPSEEAFGLVVAEAMARNLKFFGSAVGGIKDIASNVEGAELFPDGDWAALENQIARWLEAGAACPKTAGETMRARYAPEVVARKHVEIYRSVLGA